MSMNCETILAVIGLRFNGGKLEQRVRVRIDQYDDTLNYITASLSEEWRLVESMTPDEAAAADVAHQIQLDTISARKIAAKKAPNT